MNIQQLRMLLEICEDRTLLETADKLGLKQPTVSFHLHKLEEELGLSLFYKSARKLRPTEVALDLLPYARRMIALQEEMTERAKERRDRGWGKLRLGASYTPATYLLPPYFAEFQTSFPQIQLLLSVKTAETVLGMLRNYDIELAIVSLPDQSESGMVVTPLVADELKLLLSPRHPLARQETITVDDLRRERFLLHEPGSTSRQLTDEWAGKVGLPFDSVMELGAIETMKEAVKCNMGIAVLPRRSVIRETETGELLQRDLPAYDNRRHICLVYRDEELLSTNARLFMQTLLDRIEQTPA